MKRSFLMSHFNRGEVLAILGNPDSDGLLVTVENPDLQRSLEANAFYWGVLLKNIAGQVWAGEKELRLWKPVVWHEYLKGLFLGYKDVTLPSGEVLHQPRSTSKLSEKRFAAYLMEVQQWAAEQGVIIEE